MIRLMDIYRAKEKIQDVAIHTPLIKNEHLSNEFSANVYLKREDMQPVRSYKIRGAYNKLASLSESEKLAGVVCASAGNHAQGVAHACYRLKVQADLFMPVSTPLQKIKQVEYFGKEKVSVHLVGATYDQCYEKAKEFCDENGAHFIHPFDDDLVIAGQGTVGLEILKDSVSTIDYLFVPIGGGGLAAGISIVFNSLSPRTKIIGVEPAGAASMMTSIQNGVNTTLLEIDPFVDGAAVKRVGEKTFSICKETLYDVVTVPEGKICSVLLDMYNREAIVVEPAGVLSISGLDQFKNELIGKNVVCVLSGSNNDINRIEEIIKRSLLYSN